MFSFQFYAFPTFARFIILRLIKQKFQQEFRYMWFHQIPGEIIIRIYIEEIYTLIWITLERFKCIYLQTQRSFTFLILLM